MSVSHDSDHDLCHRVTPVSGLMTVVVTCVTGLVTPVSGLMTVAVTCVTGLVTPVSGRMTVA